MGLSHVVTKERLLWAAIMCHEIAWCVQYIRKWTTQQSYNDEFWLYDGS